MAKLCSDQARRKLNLFDIRGTRRHRRGEAVGRENEICGQARVGWDVSEARSNKFCPGLDEKGMVVPTGAVSDFRRFSTQCHTRVGDVLLIAFPARLGFVGREDESQSPPDSVVRHSFKCLTEKRT